MSGEHSNAPAPLATEQVALHTPGPWLLYRDNRRERYDIGVKGQFALRLVAEVSFGFSEPAESEQHANARLVAAAPDLLNALIALALQTSDWTTDEIRKNGMETTLDMMRAAIAKAEVRS